MGGLYRIDEVEDLLARTEKSAKRKPRFNTSNVGKWFRAGRAARRLIARIAMKTLDVQSLEAVAP